jgi:hypothetical protein
MDADDITLTRSPSWRQCGYGAAKSPAGRSASASGRLSRWPRWWKALAEVATAREVPVANVRQCGWAEKRSLAGVLELAAWLMRRHADWREPGPAAAGL